MFPAHGKRIVAKDITTPRLAVGRWPRASRLFESNESIANRPRRFRSRPVWSCSPDVTAKFNKLRSWVAMSDSMYEKYKQPPVPMDFGAAKKKVRDKELVDTLESFYKASKPPPETYALSEKEKIDMEQKIAYLKELDAVNKEFLPVLEAEVAFQTNNRTSAETTILDMKLNYPLIHEQIEDELERREWFKDTGIGPKK